MTIRLVEVQDFAALYDIGKKTQELRVSATEEFMDKDEFMWCLTDPDGVFLLAEDHGAIVGFIYANAKDAERPLTHKYACLVYLAVSSEYRGRGVGNELYGECENRLRSFGVSHLYTWAAVESGGEAIAFMQKHGFVEGHRYVWMDKKIINL